MDCLNLFLMKLESLALQSNRNNYNDKKVFYGDS